MTHFLDNQIHILKGQEVWNWKVTRRKVLKQPLKGCQIDGIDDKRRYIQAYTIGEVLYNGSDDNEFDL